MSRRLVCVAFGAVVSAAGCFVAYPSIARSPGAPVPAGDEVVAFAVRAKRVQHGTAPMPEERHTLRRVGLNGGRVEPRAEPYVYRSTGLMWGSIRDTYLMTKLYRPGYKTVILDERDAAAAVSWEVAGTAEEQAEAVRALASHARPGFACPPDPTFPPGSADPRHREALLFIAAEFDRVARLKWNDPATPERCRREAEKVRARAAE